MGFLLQLRACLFYKFSTNLTNLTNLLIICCFSENDLSTQKLTHAQSYIESAVHCWTSTIKTLEYVKFVQNQ